MGNCQAVDTATLVIQHPCGKAERMYWPISASEVMRTNPGHYVALLISTTTKTPHANANGTTTASTKCTDAGPGGGAAAGSVRVTRIKLLRPTDTLVLGQVYRLINNQEVMKGLRAKKCAKMKKYQGEFESKGETMKEKDVIMPGAMTRSQIEKESQVKKQERQGQRTTGSGNHVGGRSRNWQPSLQSISEATT